MQRLLKSGTIYKTNHTTVDVLETYKKFFHKNDFLTYSNLILLIGTSSKLIWDNINSFVTKHSMHFVFLIVVIYLLKCQQNYEPLCKTRKKCQSFKTFY